MTIKRKNTRIHTRKTINNRSIGGKKKSRRRKPKRHRGRKAGGAAPENITTLDDIRVSNIVNEPSAIEVIRNFNNLFGDYLKPGTTASLDEQRYAAQKYIDITNASKPYLESNENERKVKLWAVMKERSEDLIKQVENINKSSYLSSRPEVVRAAVRAAVSDAEMQSLLRNILALGVARSTSKKKGKKKKKKKKRRKKEII